MFGCCAETGADIATMNASASAPAIKRICATSFAMRFPPAFKCFSEWTGGAADAAPPGMHHVAIDSR